MGVTIVTPDSDPLKKVYLLMSSYSVYLLFYCLLIQKNSGVLIKKQALSIQHTEIVHGKV